MSSFPLYLSLQFLYLQILILFSQSLSGRIKSSWILISSKEKLVGGLMKNEVSFRNRYYYNRMMMLYLASKIGNNDWV